MRSQSQYYLVLNPVSFILNLLEIEVQHQVRADIVGREDESMACRGYQIGIFLHLRCYHIPALIHRLTRRIYDIA